MLPEQQGYSEFGTTPPIVVHCWEPDEPKPHVMVYQQSRKKAHELCLHLHRIPAS